MLIVDCMVYALIINVYVMLQQLVMNAGVALGPIAIGLIYDYGGGYQNAFSFVGLCSLVAFAALWQAGPPEAVMTATDCATRQNKSQQN